jgi:hypothetical protein
MGLPPFHCLGPDATTNTSGVMEARLQPWLGESLQGLNGGVRRIENECIVGFCNLTTQGVLPVDKLHFALQQITTLAHSHPKTFIALVILPNRAGDLRSSPCKSGTYLSKKKHFCPGTVCLKPSLKVIAWNLDDSAQVWGRSGGQWWWGCWRHVATPVANYWWDINWV